LDRESVHLKDMRHLASLSLPRNPGITGAGAAHLSNMHQLVELDLRATRFGDVGMPSLAKLTKLKILRLNETAITDSGLVYVTALKDLTELWLDGAEGIKGAGLQSLKGLTELNLLYLAGTGIDDASLASIKGLTQLEYLNLDDTKITDKGLDQLHGLSSLRDLFVAGTAVTEAGLSSLRKSLPNMRVIR
jgi:internalin A